MQRAVLLGSISSPWNGDRTPRDVQEENYRAWFLMGPYTEALTATYGKSWNKSPGVQFFKTEKVLVPIPDTVGGQTWPKTWQVGSRWIWALSYIFFLSFQTEKHKRERQKKTPILFGERSKKNNLCQSDSSFLLFRLFQVLACSPFPFKV